MQSEMDDPSTLLGEDIDPDFDREGNALDVMMNKVGNLFHRNRGGATGDEENAWHPGQGFGAALGLRASEDLNEATQPGSRVDSASTMIFNASATVAGGIYDLASHAFTNVKSLFVRGTPTKHHHPRHHDDHLSPANDPPLPLSTTTTSDVNPGYRSEFSPPSSREQQNTASPSPYSSSATSSSSDSLRARRSSRTTVTALDVTSHASSTSGSRPGTVGPTTGVGSTPPTFFERAVAKVRGVAYEAGSNVNRALGLSGPPRGMAGSWGYGTEPRTPPPTPRPTTATATATTSSLPRDTKSPRSGSGPLGSASESIPGSGSGSGSGIRRVAEGVEEDRDRVGSDPGSTAERCSRKRGASKIVQFSALPETETSRLDTHDPSMTTTTTTTTTTKKTSSEGPTHGSVGSEGWLWPTVPLVAIHQDHAGAANEAYALVDAESDNDGEPLPERAW